MLYSDLDVSSRKKPKSDVVDLLLNLRVSEAVPCRAVDALRQRGVGERPLLPRRCLARRALAADDEEPALRVGRDRLLTAGVVAEDHGAVEEGADGAHGEAHAHRPRRHAVEKRKTVNVQDKSAIRAVITVKGHVELVLAQLLTVDCDGFCVAISGNLLDKAVLIGREVDDLRACTADKTASDGVHAVVGEEHDAQPRDRANRVRRPASDAVANGRDRKAVGIITLNYINAVLSEHEKCGVARIKCRDAATRGRQLDVRIGRELLNQPDRGEVERPRIVNAAIEEEAAVVERGEARTRGRERACRNLRRRLPKVCRGHRIKEHSLHVIAYHVNKVERGIAREVIIV